MIVERPTAGTHQPDVHLADLAYWVKVPDWSAHEASAVLIGVNPTYIDHREDNFKREAQPYRERYWGVMRAAKRQWHSNSPSAWVEWAERLEFPLPADLSDHVAKFREILKKPSVQVALEAQVASLTAQLRQKQTASPSELGSAVREREMMLRLIIGMAVKKYRYAPRAHRNEATSKIVADVECVGLQTSDETVLKYLREGAQLLPGDL